TDVTCTGTVGAVTGAISVRKRTLEPRWLVSTTGAATFVLYVYVIQPWMGAVSPLTTSMAPASASWRMTKLPPAWAVRTVRPEIVGCESGARCQSWTNRRGDVAVSRSSTRSTPSRRENATDRTSVIPA